MKLIIQDQVCNQTLTKADSYARPEALNIEARDKDGVLGRDAGGAVSSPAGFGAEARPPKAFTPLSPIRVASPGTIICACALQVLAH